MADRANVTSFVKHLWQDEEAAKLKGVDRLVYRSNMLGADLTAHQHRRRQHVVEARREGPAHRQPTSKCCG